MPALEATSGHASANSFVTMTEAEAYFDARLTADRWNATTESDKIRALIEATREISALPYQGSRSTSTQALSWPREYAPDPDVSLSDLTDDYPYYPDTEVPQRVKDAQCEYALAFLVAKAAGTDLAVSDESLNVLKQSVEGAVSTEYVEPAKRVRGPARFPRVMAYLQPLLDPTKVGGLTVVRT